MRINSFRAYPEGEPGFTTLPHDEIKAINDVTEGEVTISIGITGQSEDDAEQDLGYELDLSATEAIEFALSLLKAAARSQSSRPSATPTSRGAPAAPRNWTTPTSTMRTPPIGRRRTPTRQPSS